MWLGTQPSTFFLGLHRGSVRACGCFPEFCHIQTEDLFPILGRPNDRLRKLVVYGWGGHGGPPTLRQFSYYLFFWGAK